MTLIEYVNALIGALNLLLLGIILVELREQRFARRLRESKRRAWIREEHESRD